MANEARYKVTQDCSIDLPELEIEELEEIPKKNWKEIARDILQKCWDAQTQFAAPNDGYTPWRDGTLEDIHVEANNCDEIEIEITQREPGEAKARYILDGDGLADFEQAFVLDDEDKWQIFTPNNFEA